MNIRIGLNEYITLNIATIGLPYSATLIDHIFFNSLEYYTVSENIIYAISDLLPNFVLIDNANIQNRSKKVFKRDYSNCDRNALTY